jgi:sugar phosphate isomerase/epimerase
MNHQVTRRDFLATTAATASTLAVSNGVLAAGETVSPAKSVCVFIKPLQSLGFDELADAVASLGFCGIEATVRQGGYLEAAEATKQLPRLVKALQERNLEVTVLCSDILSVDQPHAERLLQTAADLGISRYRMGFYQYDLSRPVVAQLEQFRPQLAELAKLNRKLGIQALYQNHSGANNVGGTVWDIFDLMKDIPPEEVALAFDIRHATIEAGLSWPVLYNAVKPRIGAIFVKDFAWDGRRAKHVPLGTGRVDPGFFAMLRRDGYRGLYSLHIEYLLKQSAQTKLRAFEKDLATLQNWLSTS